MSTDETEILDVEIVEDDRLPALVKPTGTHRSDPPIHTASAESGGRDWPHGPTPERRCVAHKSNGDPCKNAAIKGATVCRYHGGSAPHVKRAARARLENAADLMAQKLLGIALTADSDAVKLSAIRDALDRAGLKPPAEVVLSQGETKPYEAVFDSIGGFAPDDPSATAPVDPTDAAGVCAASSAQPSSSEAVSPPHPRDPDDTGRDSQPEPRRGASSPRPAAPREAHITGMTAVRIANESNRRSGVWEAQRALESPHKRYRRP